MKKLMVSLALLLCCLFGEAKVDIVVDTVKVNGNEYIFLKKRNTYKVIVVIPQEENKYIREFDGVAAYDHYRSFTEQLLNNPPKTYEEELGETESQSVEIDSTAVRNAWKEYYENTYAPYYRDPANLKNQLEMSLWCGSIEAKSDNIYYINNCSVFIKSIYEKYDGVTFTDTFVFTTDSLGVGTLDDIRTAMTERWENL